MNLGTRACRDNIYTILYIYSTLKYILLRYICAPKGNKCIKVFNLFITTLQTRTHGLQKCPGNLEYKLAVITALLPVFKHLTYY